MVDDDFRRCVTFYNACIHGRLEMAKLLYSLGGLDIHLGNDMVFRYTCRNGHLEVAKWLYSLGNIDIQAYDEYAFRHACRNGHTDIARWLVSIFDEYFVVIQNNKIIEWKILNPIDVYIKNKEFTKIIPIINIKKEQHNPLNIECPVCYDKTPKLTIKIECGHIFCIACINTVKKYLSNCPMCRKNITYFSYDLHI